MATHRIFRRCSARGDNAGLTTRDFLPQIPLFSRQRPLVILMTSSFIHAHFRHRWRAIFLMVRRKSLMRSTG